MTLRDLPFLLWLGINWLVWHLAWGYFRPSRPDHNSDCEA
jgi:hypothetical protein